MSRQPKPEGYRPVKSMKENRFELKVDSSLENLSIISDFITKVMRQIGAKGKNISEVQLAVDEACTNVIRHAYSERKDIITVALEIVDEDLIVTITDRGKPFEPSSIPPPDLESDVGERKIGGLGIYFMRKLMDEVSYSFDTEEGNKLTMRKHLMPKKRNLDGV
jgi:serine/threonine-protein kinase RsbW